MLLKDIKPENLLLKTQEANSDIKLGNFALALWIPEDVLGYHKIAGTLGYFAPEIVNKEIYGKPVDVWACGVILYILLVGYPPFWDDNEKVLSKIISEGKYEFYSPEWDSITDEAKSLINQLLKTDQSKRISAREALNHPWINYREEFASKLHHQNTIQGLKKFNARRKLKGAIISTMVSQRFGMLLNDKHKSDNTIGKPQDSQRKVSGNVSLPMLTKVGSLDEDFLNEIISLTANFCKVMAMNDSKTCGSICTGNFTKFELDLNINFGDTVQVTIINPRVKKIGSTGACISYSKLIQYVNEENTHMTHQTLETCLWENNGDVWKCVHLHSS
ncbi:calcium/calmodulin-dependent protein kinase type II delta chain isoform X16 [Oopsacas minuta]|uniref:Calcium/calmodulin-dependent protein kinase type II delta chain isoform X16 n=1 Tax=Oopsacas minuta TaxID=111878 RepID=A0AAV7JL92_9METZ|nr:calcium/calmodulin-dependent protein kinase type II delta chain isoform X16 [Oopsacas minuta]